MPLSRRVPSSRCSVTAWSSPTRAWSSAGRSRQWPSLTASCSRADALPVGAVSAIRSGGAPVTAACSVSSASRPATVVVLPVPGPPVSTVVHCRTARREPCRCSSYVGPAKTPLDAGIEHGVVERGRRPGDPLLQVRAELDLLLPVAVEVEQPELQPQHPGREQRTRLHRREPGIRVGPRQVRGDVAAPRQVDAHRAVAYGARGQRRREQDPLVGLPGQPRRPAGATCTSAAVEHPGLVEVRSTPVAPSASRRPPVGGSKSSVMRDLAAGGTVQQVGERLDQCHRRPPREHPARLPSTTGVSGPHMPAEVEVQHTAEVHRRVVPGLPPAQERCSTTAYSSACSG